VKEYPRVRWSDGRWYPGCEEVLDFLAEYLAGELAEERRAEFEGHLGGCDSCRSYLETYRETIRLARGASEEAALAAEIPAELVRAILASRPPR
jgi:anti-sigma factor RsiW